MNSRLWIVLLSLLPALSVAEDGGNIPDRFTIAPDPEFRSLDEKGQSLRNSFCSRARTWRDCRRSY